jgi:hypothetical protein
MLLLVLGVTPVSAAYLYLNSLQHEHIFILIILIYSKN